MEIVTADLFDRFHETVEVCDLQFRSFGKRRSFHGPCQTVKVFEDHSPLREALGEAGNGRVLVVDALGSLRVGVVGDGLAKFAIQQGWAGMVVYGATRDTIPLEALDFGIKALGTTARRAVVKTQGQIGIALRIGGAYVAPGHFIYADPDAVIVSATVLDLAPKPATNYA